MILAFKKQEESIVIAVADQLGSIRTMGLLRYKILFRNHVVTADFVGL